MKDELKRKGGRPKGLPKTGGRQKGSLNKSTGAIRAVLAEQIEEHLRNIGSLIAQIEDPRDRVAAIASVLPYIAPKMQAIDITAKQETNIRVEQTLVELDNRFSQKKMEMQMRKIQLVSFE